MAIDKLLTKKTLSHNKSNVSIMSTGSTSSKMKIKSSGGGSSGELSMTNILALNIGRKMFGDYLKEKYESAESSLVRLYVILTSFENHLIRQPENQSNPLSEGVITNLAKVYKKCLKHSTLADFVNPATLQRMEDCIQQGIYNDSVFPSVQKLIKKRLESYFYPAFVNSDHYRIVLDSDEFLAIKPKNMNESELNATLVSCNQVNPDSEEQLQKATKGGHLLSKISGNRRSNQSTLSLNSCKFQDTKHQSSTLSAKNLPKTGSSTSLASLPAHPYSIVTKPVSSTRSSETQSMVSSTDTFYMSSTQRSMSSSNNNLTQVGKKGSDDMNSLIKRNIHANRNVETPDFPTKLEADHLVDRFQNNQQQSSRINMTIDGSLSSPFKQHRRHHHQSHRTNVSMNPHSASMHSGGMPTSLAEANQEAFVEQLCAKLKNLSPNLPTNDDEKEEHGQVQASSGFKQQPSFIPINNGHDNRRKSQINSNTSVTSHNIEKTQLNFNHPAAKQKQEHIQQHITGSTSSLSSSPCILVMYYPPGEKQPFVEKFYGDQIRLCDFKLLMTSNGIDTSKCKCFFQNQLIMPGGHSMLVFEPITDDQALLPVCQGRVEAKITRIESGSK